jgi:hypothetical protein
MLVRGSLRGGGYFVPVHRFSVSRAVRWALAAACAALISPAARADLWTGEAPLPGRFFSEAGHALAALPDGRVLMIGGGENQPLREVQAWDPRTQRWSAVEPMVVPRTHHGALALPDGRVLVVGGWTDGRHGFPATSAELRDPSTGRWQATGGLARGRLDPALLLLRDGRVLVMGGEERARPCSCVPEIWDPHTGTWTARAELAGRCGRPGVAALTSERILVTGGARVTAKSHTLLADTDVFEVSGNRWTTAPAMLRPRNGHGAAVVGGGVLVAGGEPIASPEPVVELLAPGASAWRAIPAFGKWEADLPVIALASGDALVPLDRNGTGRWIAERAEFVRGADLLIPLGRAARAVPLTDGRVFLTAPPSAVPLIWSPLGQPVGGWKRWNGPRDVFFSGTLTELPGDRVLLAGGDAPRRSETTVQLGDLRAGTWQTVAPLSVPRSRHAATVLPGGDVLVTGGVNRAAEEQPRQSVLADLRATRVSHAFLRSAELWKQGRWTSTGELSVARADHTATLLGDGRVLVAGGLYYEFGPKAPGRLDFSGPRFVAETEIWSARTGRWERAQGLRRPRGGHTATLLPDGRVLVAGGTAIGWTPDAPDAIAEIWDAVSGQWSPAGNLKSVRYDHTASLLPDGRVLVAGGRQSGGGAGAVGTSEIWDPRTLTWREVGLLNIPRFGHRAVVLPGGRVLIAGGSRGGGGSVPGQAELWDPSSGRWTPTATLPTDAGNAGLARFPDGRALLITPKATLLFSP